MIDLYSISISFICILYYVYILGSRVVILEKSNDGWWRGHFNGQAGWFPSNYTTEEPPEDDHTYNVAENVLDVVVALYSFTAQNEHELSFVKGEKMEILDRPPSDPEWFRARNSKGLVSYFLSIILNFT